MKAARRTGLLCVVACLAAAAVAVARPAAVQVDRSFGDRGIAYTALPPTFEVEPFVAVSATADGGVLAKAGLYSSHYHRYRADGSSESSYDVDSYGALPEAVEANGRRLSAKEGVVRRANADGSPDASFGSGGASEKLPFEIEAIVPLPSGSILLGGNGSWINGGTKGGYYDQVYVARLTAGGKPDPSFGESGVVKLAGDEKIEGEEFVGLLPRPGDGAIVGLNGARGAVAALDGSGKLDRDFGAAGVLMPSGKIAGVEATSDGALLIAGNDESHFEQLEGSGRGFRTDFVLARYSAAGQPDRSFAAGKGAAVVDLGGQDEAHAVYWEANGSVVLAGSNTPETVACRQLGACHAEPVLVRFDAGGALDPGFGSGGVVRLRSLVGPADDGYVEGVAALAARPGGGVFAVGGTSAAAFVAAIGPDGSPVPAFAGGIVAERTLKPSQSGVGQVTVDPQRRILVSGFANAGTSALSSSGLLRYTADGQLDPTFGEGGYTLLPGGAIDVAVGPDGATFVLGSAWQLAVTKLAPDGQVDRSYGSEGIVPLGSRRESAPGGMALALLPDGDLLVAGSVSSRGGQAVVFRLRPDGSLDRAFGKGGKALLNFGRDRSWVPLRIAVAPSGRIVLAGHSNRRHGKAWFVDQLALMGVRPNGTIDRGFGHDGAVVAPVRGRGYATGLALQGKKILVAGETNHDGHFADVLLRYLPDGNLDRGFGKRGIASVPVRSLPKNHEANEEALSIATVAGRILVARGSEKGRPLLAFERDGAPDRCFVGRAGLLPGRFHAGASLALQGGNPILAWTEPGLPTPLGRGEREIRHERLSPR